jgi:asparagine synthase (glutamine-hydrolysing)
MCGICGFLRFSGAVEARVMDRMAAALGHRGPDGRGVWLDERVDTVREPSARSSSGWCSPADGARIGLGHTRLAVIDLSPAGHQPMSNEDGTVWITFNGEIYNFKELRDELVARGHQFRSATDTEVIIHLYEEEGEECVRRLNGMFAFALWDSRRKQLFAARDHLGIKPFYYTHRAGGFAFASEIKALLAAGQVSADINWQAVYDYLTFLYIPNPATAFLDVWQLPPGHTLVYQLEKDEVRVEPYWQPPRSEPGRRWERAGWMEQFRVLMADAVRRQLISDVPLGCFLSGGLDSAILVGLMARTARRVKTFTVVFEGAGTAAYDERDYAARVARQYDTEHHELVVNVSEPEDVLGMVEQFDQPFANPTFYLSALISRYTRRHVTVGLVGAGGDELFAGYPRYRAVDLARSAGRLPRPAVRLAGAAARLLPASAEWRQLHRCKLFFEGLDRDFIHRYLKWGYYFDERGKRRLLRPLLQQVPAGSDQQWRDWRGMDSAHVLERHLAAAIEADDLSRIRHADLLSYLPDNILEYTDKTSSAVGLEVRVPFLDPRVVELCLQTPVEANFGHGGKALLREAFGHLVPPANLRTGKRGFCPPLMLWMDRHFDRYFDLFLTRRYVKEQGIFDWEVIQELRAENRSRRRDNSMELFGILMFDAWYRRYVTAERPEALAEAAA